MATHLTDREHVNRLTACYACDAPGGEWLTPRAHDDQHYVVCPACGSGRLDPLPPRPEELYTKSYFIQGGALAGYLDYEADARWHRATGRLRLRRLERALASVGHGAGNRRLVDVGSATGYFMDVAQSAGWQVAGVETSDWAAERARSRGHHVEAHVDDYSTDSALDAVTLFQVLEHLPDPVGQLGRVRDRLRPGGVVLCETWDARSMTARLAGSRWQQLSPPSVLWLFTEDGMASMARAAGLELVAWQRSPKIVGLSTVLGQALPSSNDSLAGRLMGSVGAAIGIPYVFDDLVTATLVRA